MKSKRKLALAVIMALIVSMLPMTVFAEESKLIWGDPAWSTSDKITIKFSFAESVLNDNGGAAPTADGTYDATIDLVNSKSKATEKIGMYATVDKTNAKIIISSGTTSGKLSFTNGKAAADAEKGLPERDTELLGIYKGAELDDNTREAGLIEPENGTITVPDITPAEAFHYSYKYRVQTVEEPEPEKPELPSADGMKVQILRIANVSEKYIGTDFGADKYSIAEVSGDLVFVKMQGNFTKIVSGELDDTHKNDTAGTAAGEELVPKEEGGKSYVTYPFQVTKLDEPIKFCMYSGSMGKWIGYSITFSKATEGAQTITPSDIKMDENGANITAEDATDLVLTKETVGKIMQEGAPLTITNKTGVITFDGDAVSSAFAYLDGAVNFEMKDIKETNPLFADSDYAMVLDLSLTDAEGNNLFKEGGKGTAKITVPFTGEVPEGKTVKVFYITASGREEVEATYDRDAKTVTFTVSHFSQYGLEVADATKSPNTGDNSLLFVFVGLMLMSGVAFAATKKGLIK